jgi:hypothetical protein
MCSAKVKKEHDGEMRVAQQGQAIVSFTNKEGWRWKRQRRREGGWDSTFERGSPRTQAQLGLF